jgi:hypothetical protein
VSGGKESVAAGFDIAAEAAFRGHVLNIADGQPYVPGADSGGQGLISGASAYSGQDQGAAENPGIPCPELVIHKPPIVTDSHQ